MFFFLFYQLIGARKKQFRFINVYVSFSLNKSRNSSCHVLSYDDKSKSLFLPSRQASISHFFVLFLHIFKQNHIKISHSYVVIFLFLKKKYYKSKSLFLRKQTGLNFTFFCSFFTHFQAKLYQNKPQLCSNFPFF